jgi:uncharacterized protein (TIGR00369 family)
MPAAVDASVLRDGAELMRQFLPHSPFVRRMEMRAVSIEPDHVRILLPFSEHVPTYDDIVHGGAISALVDVTAMATAWSGAALPPKLRGVTVSLSIDFVDTARAEDLTGEGRVVRRGRTLTCCEVDVRGAAGQVIAKGLVTYKVG